MKHISAKLAASMIGCTPRTIAKWADRLGIPKIGVQVLLTEAQFQRVREHVRPGPGQPPKAEQWKGGARREK